MSISNYFLNIPGMQEDVKVWAQMFFDDGSVTEGKYIHRDIYDHPESVCDLATFFLEATNRIEGVLFIWGAGRVYAKKVNLLTFKGSKTLRLRRL